MPDDTFKRTTINAGKHWCELIETRNHLKERTATPAGRAPQEMVADAGQKVAALADAFLDIIDESIRAMQTLAARLGTSAETDDPLLARIYRIAHEVKGQGETFGYGLISTIGQSLCCLLERADPQERRLPASIVTHLDALSLVRARHITGDGGDLGQHLADALWSEVEVVGGPPPKAPRLSGGNQKGIELPRLAAIEPAAFPSPVGGGDPVDGTPPGPRSDR